MLPLVIDAWPPPPASAGSPRGSRGARPYRQLDHDQASEAREAPPQEHQPAPAVGRGLRAPRRLLSALSGGAVATRARDQRRGDEVPLRQRAAGLFDGRCPELRRRRDLAYLGDRVLMM